MENHLRSNNLKVSIVILHYDDIEILRECIDSCLNINHSNYEIILVLNGIKSEIHRNTIINTFKDVSIIIDNPINYGYAKGNNIGIRMALHRGAEYVLLLNDDTVVSPDFLSILVESVQSLENVGIVGPTVNYLSEPDKIWFTGATFNRQESVFNFFNVNNTNQMGNEGVVISDFITGCASLVSRSFLEQLGFLDEGFFLYWEDADWGLRAKKAGLTNFVITTSRIWHRVSASMGGDDSPFKIYHKTRSHFLFTNRYASSAIIKLHNKYFNDIVWLLIKSTQHNRHKKAFAYVSAMIDYHKHKHDEGPQWLR